VAEDGKLHISGVKETVLVVRNRTDKADFGEINFNRKELKKRHEKDYKAYFDRVELYLGATLEQQLHHQHQPGGKLLAGRGGSPAGNARIPAGVPAPHGRNRGPGMERL